MIVHDAIWDDVELGVDEKSACGPVVRVSMAAEAVYTQNVRSSMEFFLYLLFSGVALAPQ